jgi:hypothetical protein
LKGVPSEDNIEVDIAIKHRFAWKQPGCGGESSCPAANSQYKLASSPPLLAVFISSIAPVLCSTCAVHQQPAMLE